MFIFQTQCFVINNNLPANWSIPKDNERKMSNGIYTFLSTEITCIPNAISKIAGKYYSNAHCNGATWLFFIWTILHLIYDKYLEALLSKLKFKPYIRTRIKDSLWYLGFYGTAVVYCWATLHRDEVELFNFKKMHVPSQTNLSNQVVGYTLICTFYLHSSFWEGLKNGSLIKFMKFLCLAGLCTSSYILRVIEIVYTLTGIVGLSEVVSHVTRIFHSLSDKSSEYLNYVVKALFVAALGLFTILHVVIIPLTFAVPLGLKILSDYPNVLLIFLYSCLLAWLILELYHSILFNFFDHWLYHKRELYKSQCVNNLVECPLFMPRDDESYHLQILRKEAKDRQEEMISKRKPKSRNMLLQTLKCMVAIKRKVSEKRRNDTSDSDSEKSDEGHLIEEVTDESQMEYQDDVSQKEDEDKSETEDELEKDIVKDEKDISDIGPINFPNVPSADGNNKDEQNKNSEESNTNDKNKNKTVEESDNTNSSNSEKNLIIQTENHPNKSGDGTEPESIIKKSENNELSVFAKSDE